MAKFHSTKNPNPPPCEPPPISQLHPASFDAAEMFKVLSDDHNELCREMNEALDAAGVKWKDGSTYAGCIKELAAQRDAMVEALKMIATPDTVAPFYILLNDERVLVDEHAAVQWRMDKARSALALIKKP
jgi:hypothetical protein